MSTSAPPPEALGAQPGLSDKLAVLKPAIAQQVTDEFFKRHPDWLARYGQQGREDAGFHLDFLAGALASQSVAAFEDYVRWTTRVLAARGIGPRFVAENLRQIDAALHDHLSADEQAAVHMMVEAGCAICLSAPEEGQADAEPDTDADDLQVAQQLFLRMILNGQRREALGVGQDALRSGRSVLDVYTGIFQAALYRVGELWETNRITVAEEHMATAITQHVIAQLYPQLPSAPAVRGRIVLTGVQGELHQVGATMVADVLESDGWDVRFLGSNMPHSGILEAIARHQAAILAISATMLFNVPHARALIGEVQARYGSRSPRIVVGGGAFRGLSLDAAATWGVASVGTDLHGASAAMQAALDAPSPGR